jgi:hypothetical protein
LRVLYWCENVFQQFCIRRSGFGRGHPKYPKNRVTFRTNSPNIRQWAIIWAIRTSLGVVFKSIFVN